MNITVNASNNSDEFTHEGTARNQEHGAEVIMFIFGSCAVGGIH